jgi:hypothetical protein
MTATRLVETYRLTIRLYPRSFRDEYGEDLVQLFADQLCDERAPRIVARTVLDLALSVPQRHLESDMRTTRTSLLPVIFFVTALSSLVVGLVVGHPSVLALCAVVTLVFITLALVAIHRARPLSEVRSAPSRWWVALTSGAVLMAGLIVVTNATGELPEGGWLLAMITGLTALVLMGTGLVLGVVHIAGRSRRRAVAAS